MEVETAGILRYESVTDAQLSEAFRDDVSRGEFIILSQRPQVYIQAAGKEDGPYLLEYREGTDEHHYRAVGEYPKNFVEQVFRWYLAQDQRWRTEVDWQKLETKSWWKFW